MPWAALITAVGSYLAAKEASKAGRPTGTEQNVQNQLLANLKTGSGYIPGALSYASRDLGNASDYGNALLRGGYQNQLAMLGPELGANARANQAGLTSSLRFLPRASGTGSERLGLLDSMSSNTKNSLLTMRPNAANFLASLGGTEGGFATSLMAGNNNGGLGLLGFGLQNRQFGFDASRAGMLAALQGLGGLDFGGGGSVGADSNAVGNATGMATSNILNNLGSTNNSNLVNLTNYYPGT